MSLRSLCLGCLCVVVTLDACSLITPLDFVGSKRNASTAGAAGATEDFTGSGGTEVAAAGCSNEAGASSNFASGGSTTGASNAGAGIAGVAGNAGTSTLPDLCAPACGPIQICKAGTCICPDGRIACNGVCLDSLTEAGYCGKCGVVCRADQICTTSGCTCPSGGLDCGSVCLDVSADPENCGACGKVCAKGQPCIAGGCRTSPCDGLCTNPRSPDPDLGDGVRFAEIGTSEACLATSNYRPTATVPRLACWSAEGRTVRVNGVALTQPCESSSVDLQPQKQGWYCIQVSAGPYAYTGILLPTVKP